MDRVGPSLVDRLRDMERRLGALETAQYAERAYVANMAERFEHDGLPVGVFNGQFELPPPAGEDAPEGWTVTFGHATAYIEHRTTGGLAGGSCVRLGSVTATHWGAQMDTARYLPVDQGTDYAYALAARGAVANTRIGLSILCYDEAKALLSVITPFGATIRPGTAWARYSATVGPSGTAWPANTRYARPRFVGNRDGDADEWSEVDNVVFRPA